MYRVLLSLLIILPLLFSQSFAEEKDPSLLKPTPEDIVMGKEDAPVLMVEYASLSCPHCAHFHNKIFPSIKEKYIDTGKVKFVFRAFPLNPPALHGTVLAYCAGDTRFYNFLKVLFDTQDSWAFNKNYLEMLTNIGKLGGIKSEAFDKCLEDKDLEFRILTIKQYAVNTLKIRATPTLYVNGEQFQDAIEVEPLSKFIDNALKDAPTAPVEEPQTSSPETPKKVEKPGE